MSPVWYVTEHCLGCMLSAGVLRVLTAFNVTMLTTSDLSSCSSVTSEVSVWEEAGGMGRCCHLCRLAHVNR